MTIAILGATGYLGSKLAHIFIEMGYKVLCFKRDSSNCDRLKDIEQQIIYYSLDRSELDHCFIENKVDFFINTSCSYIKKGTSDLKVVESNFCVPFKVLESAVRFGVSRIISIGTVLPNDFNVYTISKHHFNRYGEYYCNKNNVTFINLEVGNFYGTDEPSDRFIPFCINKLYKNEPIDLTNGLQKRDFIHVDDVLGLICHLVNMDIYNPQGMYLDIPVGTGESVSIREIVEYLKVITGSQSALNFGAIPLRPEETDCVVDISIMKKYGYNNKYNWKDGLKTVAEELS